MPTLTTGLLYLTVSVICSVSVAVLLKLARRYDIDISQAIAANYVVTATLCALVLSPTPAQIASAGQTWGPLIALGVIMPTGFMAMAQSVRHAGIVRSDAAQRLSLFLPLLAAFLLFGEDLTWRKSTAIALAFSALFCVLRRRSPADHTAANRHTSPFHAPRHAAPTDRTIAPTQHTWLWPLGVWITYGLVDIIFKQIAKSGAAFSGALLIGFILAGIAMTAYLLILRVTWQSKHLLAGIILGIMNFGNIVTYIRAHQSLPGHPALVFASMNMGVIIAGTLVGAIAFREPLSRINVLGLVIAVIAIGLMMPV